MSYFPLKSTITSQLSVNDFKGSVVRLREVTYREFSYSKTTEKWPGQTQGVRLKEVSVNRELTVYIVVSNDVLICLENCPLYNLFDFSFTACKLKSVY